jgi:hypothetical protein
MRVGFLAGQAATDRGCTAAFFPCSRTVTCSGKTISIAFEIGCPAGTSLRLGSAFSSSTIKRRPLALSMTERVCAARHGASRMAINVAAANKCAWWDRFFRMLSIYFSPQSIRAHSWRNATMGSTLAARRAGAKQATSATAITPSGATTKVVGSVGRTPNSRLDKILDSPHAPAIPAAAPAAATASLASAPGG